jgi:hypothetical protein
VHPHERRRSLLIGVLALASLLAPAASAFEFFDQRLQIHGFAEMQLRAIARDFEPSDGIDLTQWYNVLNVEVDYAFVRDGWGPFLFLSAFARRWTTAPRSVRSSWVPRAWRPTPVRCCFRTTAPGASTPAR